MRPRAASQRTGRGARGTKREGGARPTGQAGRTGGEPLRSSGGAAVVAGRVVGAVLGGADRRPADRGGGLRDQEPVAMKRSLRMLDRAQALVVRRGRSL